MTATSRFGTSKRERHDATAFYERGLASVECSDDGAAIDAVAAR